MRQRLARYSTAATPRSDADQESRARLQALGYVGGGPGRKRQPIVPIPKDRRALAARLAQVTSGELARDGTRIDAARNPAARCRRIRWPTCVSATCCRSRRDVEKRRGISSRQSTHGSRAQTLISALHHVRPRPAVSTPPPQPSAPAIAPSPTIPSWPPTSALCFPMVDVRLKAIPHLQQALTLDPASIRRASISRSRSLDSAVARTRRAKRRRCWRVCRPMRRSGQKSSGSSTR